MDMQPVIETSKYAMINNLRTGNIIIDTILSLAIMVIINQLISKTQNIDFSALKNIFTVKTPLFTAGVSNKNGGSLDSFWLPNT